MDLRSRRADTGWQWLIGVAMFLAAGCGGSRPAAPITDLEKVGLALDYVEDVKGNPKFLAMRFAAGSVPPVAELRKYAGYSYQSAGKPSASGDTAALPVKVLGPGNREVGQVEWTFVRDGDGWKVRAAPLP